jgi:hypothetical protein
VEESKTRIYLAVKGGREYVYIKKKKRDPKNIERASLTWQRKHDKSTRQKENKNRGSSTSYIYSI